MTTVIDRPPLILGIMSGTSVDGIDIAIMRMQAKPELIHFSELAMPDQLHEPLLRLAVPGINEIDQMGELSQMLGKAFADAALSAIAAAGLQPSDIAAIGCHGQTIRHRPRTRHPFTLQIGNPAIIAERTGITTVSDFRSRDIAAGGEGAPLVPFSHRRLFASDSENIAVLNLGGIANITWLGKDGTTTGFDCGPGNMLMDALMLERSDGRNAFDSDGELAAAGHICQPLLEELMQHPFVKRSPPKSTGREEFGREVLHHILAWPDLSDADRMASTAAFTVQCVAEAVDFLPSSPAQWLICGGGVRNRHLMRSLGERLAPAQVKTSDSAGLPAQAVEAASFAILAEQTLRGASNTISTVTGASHAVCGGNITPGSNWPDLLHDIAAWTR
ncbi:MAG: anhydro-N-acetylmuramic acid kinase [Mariprofundaceae bacterium]|nr:anhydro-N-acetylmuramic acid kinase [Mariprofundaceae bacterium]